MRAELVSALAPNFAQPPTVFVSVTGLVQPRPRVVGPAAPPPEPVTIATFITGEVASPGRIEVEPGTTILQLIAQAGGLSRFAAERRIELRRTDRVAGRVTRYLFSYSGVADGPRISGATVLHEGDVIVVPERKLFE